MLNVFASRRLRDGAFIVRERALDERVRAVDSFAEVAVATIGVRTSAERLFGALQALT
jgi:hypothetical protein